MKALLPSDLAGSLDLTGTSATATDAMVWERDLRAWANAELNAGADCIYPRAHKRLEQVLLEAALAATGGHRQQAAKRLGLGRNTFARKLGSRGRN